MIQTLLFLLLSSFALAEAPIAPIECEKLVTPPLTFNSQGHATIKNNLWATLAGRLLFNLNELEDAAVLFHQDKSNDPYFMRLARALRLKIDFNAELLQTIPKTGAMLVASNHATNGVDGVVLASIFSQVRSDVKVLLSEALRGVPGMPENAIFIDTSDSRRSAAGVRQILRHWEKGGVIIAFPSGEVSQKINGQIVDPQWQAGLIALLEMTKAPVTVMTAFVEGHTDFGYRLARKLWDISWVKQEHAEIATGLMNIRAIGKRAGTTMSFALGSPITKETFAKIEKAYPGTSLEEKALRQQKTADYARSRSLLLKRNPKAIKFAPRILLDIADEIPFAELQSEFQNKMRVMFDTHPASATEGTAIYFAQGHDIPKVMLEIGRLREITFRQVGEGSGLSRDNDRFDDHYHHLIAFDKSKNKIMGSYRVGLLDQILKKYGIQGIYNSEQYRFSNEMIHDVLPYAAELGRSFITEEYQRTLALFLLLRGVAKVVIENQSYVYLTGAVSISGSFSRPSQLAMINFLIEHYGRLDEMVFPKHPVNLESSLTAEEWKQLYKIHGVKDNNSFKALNEMVQELEGNKDVHISPLLKIYADVTATYLAFNFDREFNTVDGYISVYLPAQSEKALKRFFAEEIAIIKARNTRQ